MKLFKENLRRVAGASLAVGSALVAAAAKADDSGIVNKVTTGAASATSDINSVGGIIVGVLVAIAAIAWIRRVIK